MRTNIEKAKPIGFYFIILYAKAKGKGGSLHSSDSSVQSHVFIHLSPATGDFDFEKGRGEKKAMTRLFDPWPVFFKREWKRNWPFLVGFATTGTIITKFTLGLAGIFPLYPSISLDIPANISISFSWLFFFAPNSSFYIT